MKRLIAACLALLPLSLVAPARADMVFAAAARDGSDAAVVFGRAGDTGGVTWRIGLRPPGPDLGTPVAVAVSSNGSFAALVTSADRLVVYDTSSGSVVSSFDVPMRPTHVSFCAEGRRVAVARGVDVAFYDVLGGARQATFRASGPIISLGESPLSRVVTDPRGGSSEIVAGELLVLVGGTLIAVHPFRGVPSDSFSIPSSDSMSVLPDGRVFLRSSSSSSRMLVINLGDRQEVDLRFDAPLGPSWAVSADGARVLSTENPRVLVHDVGSQKRLKEIDGGRGVGAIVVPGDGSTALMLAESQFGLDGLFQLHVGPEVSVGELSGEFTVLAGAFVETVSEDHGALEGMVSSRASQSSVDGVASALSARLDVAVSSRASQSSVNALSADVATKSSQVSVNALSADVATKSSQSSVNALSADVAAKSSQASVDALGADVAMKSSQASVDAVASDVGALSGDVAARASQSSVDALTGDVADVDLAVDGVRARLDARLDVEISTRASQASLDALALQESDRADRDAADHEAILASVGGGARQQIEASLSAGLLQPLFFMPGGSVADPALDGACGGLPPAGHAMLDEDGLFEAVRCITRRALDGMRAIGEDVRRAEGEFAQAEADRLALPPRYRDAAEGYAQALQVALRGH